MSEDRRISMRLTRIENTLEEIKRSIIEPEPPDRMIPPHALEVCYNKTTHIIFPAEITYVDLGNENLVAGIADGAENVLRVKSAFKSFKQETNLSVITEDGSYYTFSAPIIGAW